MPTCERAPTPTFGIFLYRVKVYLNEGPSIMQDGIRYSTKSVGSSAEMVENTMQL